MNHETRRTTLTPTKVLVCPVCDDEFVSDQEWDGLGILYCPDCVADMLNGGRFTDVSEPKDV